MTMNGVTMNEPRKGTLAGRRILGLDPANRCGWAWSDGPLGKTGTQQISGVWDLALKSRQPGDRLQTLLENIRYVARRFGIDMIAYEDARLGSHFFHVQAAHNELKAMIRLVAKELSVPLLPVNPRSLKKYATNWGKAQKWQMIRAARTILGAAPQDDNEADALWVLDYARSAPEIPPAKPRPKGRKAKSPQGRLF